jgi:hypothetical protein
LIITIYVTIQKILLHEGYANEAYVFYQLSRPFYLGSRKPEKKFGGAGHGQSFLDELWGKAKKRPDFSQRKSRGDSPWKANPGSAAPGWCFGADPTTTHT